MSDRVKMVSINHKAGGGAGREETKGAHEIEKE